MAAKSHPISPESAAANALTHYPPPISLSSPILASALPLPPSPFVSYAVFAPAPAAPDPLDTLELARRAVLRRAQPALVASLLPTVCVDKDALRLYVFAVDSLAEKDSTGARAALGALCLEGLSLIETATFTPGDVYPCSPACAMQRKPCPTCRIPDSGPVPSTPDTSSSSPTSPSSRYLPRIPLRPVLASFLRAVRERLIDDLCMQEGDTGKGKERQRRMCRLKDGFVLFPPSAGARISEAVDWGMGWEHNASNRPLVHCTLHLYLTSTRILLHPHLRATHFLPLCPSPNSSQLSCRACPLEACTPITLLPYGTPAYYLTAYTGPTAALTHLFRASLTGLGCAALLPPSTSSQHTSSSSTDDPTSTSSGAYMLAWVPVQNRQGEQKGLTVIWPTGLALRFVSSAPVPHARTRLATLPVLPVQLMPSPPMPSANASVAASAAGTPAPEVLRPPPLLPALTRRPCLSTSSAARRVLRTLTMGGVGGIDRPCAPDVGVVAKEAEAYVDAVAKEREKERERLRREREAASGAGPSQTETPPAAQIPPQVQAQAQVQQPPPAPEPEPFYPSPSPSAGSMPPATAIPLAPPPAPPPMLSTGSATPAPAPMEVPSTTDAATAPALDAFTAPLPLPQGAPLSGPDAFGDFDAWAHDPHGWLASSSGGFMNMPGADGDADMGVGVGVGMDMDMGMDAITSSGAGAWGAGAGGDVDKMDVDAGMDEIFTDADFDFWDAKPAGAGAGAGSSAAAGAAPMAAAAMVQAQPLFAGAMQLSGPGPPAAPPQPAPWVPAIATEGFPPSIVGGLGMDSFAAPPSPGLFPPSPIKTPESHAEPLLPSAAMSVSAASKPALQKTASIASVDCVAKLDAPLGSSVFDPLPFSSVHRIADGKYTAGKFALPSPPDEEDRTRPIPLFSNNANANSIDRDKDKDKDKDKDNWRMRYDAVTDPRVGVVRKLIGVKRKSFDQGARDAHTTPSPEWARGVREWTADVIHDTDEGEADDDGRSDAESDDDDDPWIEEEEPTPPPGTRPSTPAPAYLPLGPTLLHTHFQHAQLLPLSTALRPPEVALSPPNITTAPAPVSVPTPVSPAAVLGATTEKSKSLEAAAHILAKEVVESCVWGDAWRANAPDYVSECRMSTDVWPADAKQVARTIAGVRSLQGPFELGQVFAQEGEEGEPRLEPLESPMISVGKSDSIVQVLPTAIRFWEKLGLVPRAGKKDVIAFVLFEDLDEARQILVERWLKFVSTVYTANNLGSHTPGRSSSCTRDGLVPLKFDSFRKTLAPFVNSLPAVKAHYVFYIATPAALISLTSTSLRQVFSAVKRAQKTYAAAQILFQFLPAHLVYSTQYPPVNGCQLLYLSCVYDRILRPVDRVMSRRFFEHGERIRAFFQEPAFTIARPAHTKVHMINEAPARTLDVVDRYMLLHVGYRISSCGRWIFAACIDQRGEAHDLGVWLSSSESPETHLVQQLWTFAVNFAKKASVEWRIAFAKLGSMGPTELDAWINHLSSVVPDCPDLPAVHVSLLSADPDASWTFIAPPANAKRPTSPNRSSKNPAGSFFVDVSSSTYCLFYPLHMTLVQGNDDLGTALSHIPDAADTAASFSSSLPLRPLNSTTLIRVPSSTDYTSISMLHIHLLHTFKSRYSSLAAPDEQTHQDITRNYYELSVLAQLRHLKANPILPFHLGALDIMDMALSGSFAVEA
ncbi:hypothetical protein DENSPDRAFT_862140 [Dentipellis sp. KUC8613]|nr:hypothetical protein DENSPDRAFT_862140 [Dentipellis sp. KUC8613]